jgi:uncharacterized membrane protein
MSSDVEQRLDALERHVNGLAKALNRLEHEVAPGRTDERAAVTRPPGPVYSRIPASRSPKPRTYEAGRTSHGDLFEPPPLRAPVARNRAARPKPWSVQVEELLGGRLLAWAGGITVVLGVAFFVALAIKRGWIDEQTRILISFLGSLALGGAGVWLRERQGRTQASMAMVGTSIAALYLTLTAACQLYELIAIGPGLGIAFAIGVAATAVAVRWDSPVIAGLGIVGALAAPVLVGAGVSNGSLAFVLIALASAVGVLVWRRWDGLAVAAFIVSAPQLLVWAFDSPSLIALALGLTFFWLLNVAASLGYELRVGESGLRESSTLLLVANAAVAALGYAAFQEIDAGTAADIWISLLAVTHVAVGVVALTSRRVARDIGVLAVGLGVLLADLALGLTVSGPALAAGWAAGAIPFVLIGRQEVGGIELRRVALVWHLVLASVHVLAFDASPASLVEGSDHLVGGILSLGALAAVCIGCARRLSDGEDQLRIALDAAGLATLAYLAAFALDGVILTATWAGAALALAVAGTRVKYAPSPYAAGGFLTLALGHVLIYEAPPDSLIYGVDHALVAFAASGAVAIAAIGASQLGVWSDARWKLALEVLGASLVVYIGSAAIVDAFQPHTAFDTGLDLEVRQRGQAILSGFWSVTGLAALVWGLVRNSRVLRLGGFALLALALSKVFLYDLSTLEALWRVLSFVALGLLLLAGAFAYQRMQPPQGSGLSSSRRRRDERNVHIRD